jgi:hypothetical protein
MYRSTTRWSTAVAAAALIALPVAASAQTTGTSPQQPPAAQSPTPSPQPTPAPPTGAQPPTSAAPAAGGQVDAAAAKQHLSEARDSLSQLTSLPEAAKLQGDHRNEVSQLISNFNELITTQANWRASYDKVDANLTALLGPDAGDQSVASGTAGAVGTSGSAAAGAAASSVDPAIRAKLVDFRTHLKAFQQAAGGGSDARSGDSTGAMAPAAATASTSNPANPASSAAQPNSSQPTAAGATGTSGVMSSPTADMSSADRTKAAAGVGHQEADKHLDAISDILNKSKTGTLTRAQTTELKKHVAELRRLLQQQQ